MFNSYGNRKISKFGFRELTQYAKAIVKRWHEVLVQVNPAYTTVAAKLTHSDLELDLHRAAAYVIGLRALRKLKSI